MVKEGGGSAERVVTLWENLSIRTVKGASAGANHQRHEGQAFLPPLQGSLCQRKDNCLNTVGQTNSSRVRKKNRSYRGGSEGTCGGHRGLAHLLTNTETESRVKWLLRKCSQCLTWSECSKQAAGNRQCARGEVVLTCVCIVCRKLHTNHNHSSNDIK